ncbi:hypothetical protein ACAG24_024165 [Mycobacterium sp. pW049]|uniref:hypothetical protein n=1 Tax=[Mycobacterium] bulgaricum TaxID=3238985 RepID=UPI00351AD564
MVPNRHYAAGTAPTVKPNDVSGLVAESVIHLLASCNDDGTWGGPDALDQLITTCHVLMTLMAVGIEPTSPAVAPGLNYLHDIDADRYTTFYWRSGPLLGVDAFSDAVAHDVRFLMQHLDRSGGTPKYPAPFFLLKLLLFNETAQDAVQPGQIDDLVGWLLAQWREDTCWNDRPSLSSMGLALLIDDERMPAAIVERTTSYLIEKFAARVDSRDGFSDNIIDDAYVVYNFYERWSSIGGLLPEELTERLERCALGLVEPLRRRLPTPPPFGGAVDSWQYSTAILIRAVSSYEVVRDRQFDLRLAVTLATSKSVDIVREAKGIAAMEPFWGPLSSELEDYCFVLMPFSPQRRNEIYEEYIKRPLVAELGIPCRRADDFYSSRQIMGDIWDAINRAKLIVADLSDKNANVFYELGMAHVLGKSVILVAERHDDIPFDLQGIRTIIYGDSPSGWKRLAKEIVEYARPLVSSP